MVRILEEFIAKELRPYIRTFDTEYYEHLFKLRGLQFPRNSVKLPQYFGYLTNHIVYVRLAPGVLEELRKIPERRVDGRLKHPFTRRLTEDIGQVTRASRVGHNHHEAEQGLRYRFHGKAR